jgi:hypothetical protein
MIKWNQCIYCGRFISLHEFDTGEATRKLFTPDSYCSAEEYTTMHKKCEIKQSKYEPKTIKKTT